MRSALVFGGCFVLWLLLSGHFGVLEVTLGLLAAALVTVLSRRIEIVSDALRVTPRVPAYVAWLLVEVVRSNIQVAQVVLSPRLPIDPVVGSFRVPFDDPLALTTLGNSITLTPGTVTIDAAGQELTVHSLLGPGPIASCQGPMTRRVARVFRQPAP